MDAITNDTNKFLMILGIVAMGLSGLLAKIIGKMKGSFKPYTKATIFYSIICLFFFAAIAFTAHPDIFTEPLTFLIFYQVYFLLFGCLHFYLMHQLLRWSGDESTFWAEVLYTVILGMLGSIGFVLVYRFVNEEGLGYLMTISSLFFVIPLFVFQTFRKATAIPPRVLKHWLYPLSEDIQEPDESKMKNLLVISFEFHKKTSDSHYTNFRAKAPTDMEFGQLFYHFINDYNERHPNEKVEFISDRGDVHGWIFYKKPKWYSFLTQYVDTGKTIYTNNIRENDIIICSRTTN
jgi:hypothetical protein